MSLRWRGKKYNNELVCGAKSKPKENDTYIGDRLHYKLAEVYFKAELKQFYKAMKKDFLSKVATTTWVSPEWKKEILEKKKKDIESKLEEIKQGK